MRRLLLLVLVALPAASAPPVALGVHAASSGAGLALTVGVVPLLNLRAGGQVFSLDRTRVQDGTSYDAELRLRSGMLLADLHPVAGSFRISAGLFFSGNEVRATSSEDSFVTLNGTRYPVAVFGQVHGSAKANSVCPYLGIGWGNAVKDGRRVRLAADLGAYYQGSPRVALTATPGSFPLPAGELERFRQDLEAERQDIEADAHRYRFFPLLSVGLSYRF